MARLKERQTGSVVNVPDEKVDQVVALGHYEPVKDTSKKTTTKSK